MWGLAFGCALWAALTVFFASRDARRAVAWGALWGVAAGFSALAPLLLDVHHLRPTSFLEWAALDLFLAMMFAVVGAALILATTILLAPAALTRRQNSSNPVWASAVWSAITLPIVYLAASALIEMTQAGGSPPFAAYWTAFRSIAVAYLIVIALLIAYRQIASRGWDRQGRALGGVICMLAGVACLTVPWRVAARQPRVNADAASLTRQSSTRSRAPLLVIGLDGGNWQTLRPLIDRGSTPTFARLLATGLHGEIEAPWPPYWSTPAWGAIVTGHSQEENGVHEDLSAAAPGLPAFELPLAFNLALDPLFVVEFGLTKIGVIEPMPTPRDRLAWPPIWERLSRAGVKVAVVRFPFTYPAQGQATHVISNRVVADLWGALSVKPGAKDRLIEPPRDAERWLASVSDDQHVDAGLFSELLARPDWPKPADAIMDPVDVLRRATATEERMNDAATAIVREDPQLAVMMLHIAGFDEVCHAFWQYRFPAQFPDHPPARNDVEQLGPVIDRYLQLLDRRLADLMGAFSSPPNVLVVSDHGEGPAPFHTIWRGWHASPGIFLAAGPDIPHRENLTRASYYDVAPTILELQGFDQPSDLAGHSRLAER